MAKQLEITFEGKKYTLEFTRDTVRQMERAGFNIDDIFNSKPVTAILQLFYGAFLANHRNIKSELVERIYDAQNRRGELISRLAEMYREPMAALIDDPEDSEGNATWAANWERKK